MEWLEALDEGKARSETCAEEEVTFCWNFEEELGV
jgi:hypothetical protein